MNEKKTEREILWICKLELPTIYSWILELSESNDQEGLDELVACLCLEPLSVVFLPPTVLEADGGLDARTNLLGASAFFIKEID
jgi:hypothetical protein